MDRRAGVIVHVMCEVGRLFVEAATRNEGVDAQMHQILIVQDGHADPEPFVEHDPRPDVLADTGDEALERSVATGARQPGERHGLAVGIAEWWLARPGANQLGAERDRLGQIAAVGQGLVAKAPDILAMDAGQQADTAVGLRLVVDLEFVVRDFDEDALQHVGEIGVGDALPEHQAHHWAHHPLERLNQRLRWGYLHLEYAIWGTIPCIVAECGKIFHCYSPGGAIPHAESAAPNRCQVHAR